MAFDVTDKQTFLSLDTWLGDVGGFFCVMRLSENEFNDLSGEILRSPKR